jgi:thiamine biosynthesis lipoprotein
MEYDEFSAMNTLVQVAAEGDPKDLQPGFEQVRQFVAQSEERFSRFRETSELTYLNRCVGSWFYASPGMFDLVKVALKLHKLTGGLFDPSILGALQQAGYDRSMDEIRRNGAPSARPGWDSISARFAETRLDPETHAILLPFGTQIDLGGIAKGWIAERAAERLYQFTDACAVSAGGDMALFGLPFEQSSWEVSLEDPLDADQVFAILRIPAGGLATSTVTRRQWLQDGQPRHHIIDPRSGKPANARWLSVSVYAKSVLYAEAFAKALLIAGPSEAKTLLSSVDDLQYSAVDLFGELSGNLETTEMIHVPEPIL